jgi:hypothetical protein
VYRAAIDNGDPLYNSVDLATLHLAQGHEHDDTRPRSRYQLGSWRWAARINNVLETIAARERRACHPWPERDLAFVATALLTGLRLSELLGLDLGSIDGREGEKRLVRQPKNLSQDLETCTLRREL